RGMPSPMPSSPARAANASAGATWYGMGLAGSTKSCSQSTWIDPGMWDASNSARLACGSGELGWRPRTSSTRMSRSRLPASHSALTKGPGGISNPGGVVLMTRPFRRAAGRRLRLLGHGREVVPAHAAGQLRVVGRAVGLERVDRLVDRLAASQVSAQALDDLGHEPSLSRVVL